MLLNQKKNDISMQYYIKNGLTRFNSVYLESISIDRIYYILNHLTNIYKYIMEILNLHIYNNVCYFHELLYCIFQKNRFNGLVSLLPLNILNQTKPKRSFSCPLIMKVFLVKWFRQYVLVVKTCL